LAAGIAVLVFFGVAVSVAVLVFVWFAVAVGFGVTVLVAGMVAVWVAVAVMV
jgi:hypothetical protein